VIKVVLDFWVIKIVFNFSVLKVEIIFEISINFKETAELKLQLSFELTVGLVFSSEFSLVCDFKVLVNLKLVSVLDLFSSNLELTFEFILIKVLEFKANLGLVGNFEFVMTAVRSVCIGAERLSTESAMIETVFTVRGSEALEATEAGGFVGVDSNVLVDSTVAGIVG